MNKRKKKKKEINGFDTEYDGQRSLWMELWMETRNMSATCHANYGRLYVVTLRVKQNSFVLFFELVVAKCFYVSKNLFPDFDRH